MIILIDVAHVYSTLYRTYFDPQALRRQRFLLWVITVWKEHTSIFGTAHLTNINFNKQVLSLVIPLLALPQITHYILDGFFWKIREDEFKWNNEVKTGNPSTQLYFEEPIK